VTSEKKRDRGDELVRGEYGVIEMDKVQNWVRGRELRRRCRRYESSISFIDRTVRMPGKGKGKTCDVVSFLAGVARSGS
jgi:hypothetical protein